MEADLSIYYAIRLEDKKGKSFGDAAFKSKKDAFSSNHIGDCVRALLNHSVLKKAFDPLLELPGLRPGMRFSTLHKLCCAKSDEEAATYLQHTFSLWLGIALGSLEDIQKIEARDVQALELRCPKLCSRDAADIEEMFMKGKIFSAFDQGNRQAIKEKILSIDYVIPSLRTFFQDVHLLELCAASMRHIVTPAHNMTLRSTLRHNYKPLEIEPSMTSSLTTIVPTSESVSFDMAMELLWIFVLGQFQRMPPPNMGSSGRLLAGYLVEKPQIDILIQFSKIAQSLGFNTPEIKQLSQLTVANDSECSVNYKFGSQSRLTPFFLQNIDFASSLVNKSIVRPSLYAKVLRRRCGRPKNDLFQHDRTYLKKDLIHYDYGELNIKGQDITSFIVLRSQCLLFFSKENIGGIDLPTTAASTLEQTGLLDSVDFITSEQNNTQKASKSSDLVSNLRAASSVSEESQLLDSNNSRDIQEGLESLSESEHAPTSNLVLDTKQLTKGLSGAKFEFLKYDISKKKLVTFKEANESDVDVIVRGMAREEMRFYNLDIYPVDVERCFESAEDMNTVILLPLKDLNVTDELKKEAKEYREEKQRIARQFLRR